MVRNARSGGRRPSSRPSSSTRRTTSAGKPESGCEPEAAAVHAPERDLTRPVDADRVGDPPGSVLHIARKAQRTRQNAGAAAGDKAEREAGTEAVQRLAERAVAAKDHDRARIGVTNELDRMARANGGAPLRRRGRAQQPLFSPRRR